MGVAYKGINHKMALDMPVSGSGYFVLLAKGSVMIVMPTEPGPCLMVNLHCVKGMSNTALHIN